MLNQLALQEEKEQRARLREYQKQQKAKLLQEKEKAKQRKSNAQKKNYKISTIEDNNRINGFINDYIFYQFFALDDELQALDSEFIKEITPVKKKFIAEWRAAEPPEIHLKQEIENRGEIKNHSDFSFAVIVFLFLSLFVSALIALFDGFRMLEREPEEILPQIEISAPPKTEYNSMPLIEYQEPEPPEPAEYKAHPAAIPHSVIYLNKSIEELRAEDAARKKQEKAEKRFKKQTEKIEKRIQKLERKAEKKQLKQQKKQEKMNKKKDKKK